jgi:hypothetical protein
MQTKKLLLRSGAILSGLAGLLLIPDMLYNACGIAEIQDCADGPKWIMALHIFIAFGLFFLTFWLFRESRSQA